MDAAEYKHVVLGLIFLKYISDTFDEHHATLIEGKGQYEGANPEDPDEYKAENVFWLPQEARWSHLQAHAKQPTIGKLVDDAAPAAVRLLSGPLRRAAHTRHPKHDRHQRTPASPVRLVQHLPTRRT